MTQFGTNEQSTQEMLETLTKIYGPILPSRTLWRILGYTSPAAFRQARIREQIPVVEFEIEGRRGRFALTSDVANWLTKIRAEAIILNEKLHE